MTHLFPDDQVILSPGWLEAVVPLPIGEWRHLRLFRPSTLDLILTKMMREDPQDLSDIGFLLRQESISTEQLERAWAEARVPDLDEIRDAFAANRPRVLSMLSSP